MSKSTTNSALIYTSETGVESDEPIIVEHVVNTTVRMNDPQYGIKTAAPRVREQVKRAEFLAQKAEVLGRQRSQQQAKREAKIAALTEDINRIRMSLISGNCSDKTKAQEVLSNMEARLTALTGGSR